MLKESKNGNLDYQKLSKEEMERRGILGRLVGICADFINPTRNGRGYSEDLWEKVFNSDIMKERIANRVCYGELGHPENREETDIEKVAICLAEQPTKGPDGKLRAVFDILNTKNGQILKTLCDYGSTLGISSRGSGDLISDYNGNESVDPDTYNCEGFDIVLIPAVKEARLKYVTESLDTKKYNKTLRERLTEELDKASDDEKKIMTESLNTLGIKLNEEKDFFGQEIYKGWKPEDIEKHKEIDWKARNYSEYVDPEDSFTGEAIMYLGNGETEKKQVKFVKAIRPNAVFSPYYRPEENPFKNSIGPMYDGKSHGAYDIHDRYETPEVYRSLSEDLDDNPEIVKDGDGYSCEYMGITYSAPTEEELLDKIKEAKDVYKKISDETLNERFDPSSYTNAIKAISDGIKDDTNEEDLLDYLCHIYKYIKEIADDYNLTLCESTEQETNEPDEVVNDEAEEEIDAEFLESLAKNKQLTQDNLSLQEKLSVCTAKEVQLNEDLKKYKASIIRLSDKAKEVNSLNKEINSLKESLERKNNIIKVNNSKLGEVLKENKTMKSYNEDLEIKYSDLEKKEKSLSEQLNKLESENTKLNENLIKYKKAYNKAKETIVESKAAAYGIDKEELLSNLNESYTIKDIDSKCKELSDHQRNMNSLPFRINKNSKVSIKESKEYISPDINNDDDDISSLIKLL